jgi:TolA-binding protein
MMLFGCSQASDNQVKNQTRNDSNTNSSTETTTTKQLEQRIVQLEKRVKQLEQRVEQQEPTASQVERAKEQYSKALENEAKSMLTSINRGQQAYRLENEKFAARFDDLSYKVLEGTEDYKFKTQDDISDKLAETNEKYDFKIQKAQGDFTVSTAISTIPQIAKSFIGIVYIHPDSRNISTEICVLKNSSNLSSKLAMNEIIQNEQIVCP